MKQAKKSASFYVESLLLLAVFIAVILIILQCLSTAYRTRTDAKNLNEAASLARNAAEILSEGEGIDGLAFVLTENDNATVDGSQIIFSYDEDFNPNEDGNILLVVTETQENTDAGIMLKYDITVTDSKTSAELYSLDTEVYQREDGGAA